MHSLVSSNAALREQVVAEFRDLKNLVSGLPRDIGYPWDAGDPKDHVLVDDGLDPPFFLPRDFCSTPTVRISCPPVPYVHATHILRTSVILS